MPEDFSDQTPKVQTSTQSSNSASITAPRGIFPDKIQQARITNYRYYEQLFYGEHYAAFNQRIQSEEFNKAYSKLRYVVVNFAGMITKIASDMLFSEPVTIEAQDKSDQDYMDALWDKNHMDVQLYEGALSNSYNGDDTWKVRVGKRHPNDKKSEVIIEQFSPSIYFPTLDPFNARSIPTSDNLMWVFDHNGKQYLRKEVNTPGNIANEVYRMEGDKIMEKVDSAQVGLNLKEVEVTNIERSLIVHLPNWKTGNRFFGVSDYYDLDTLFYAVNNRLTKIDNILDFHSDPILMIPPGLLDEKGRFKKKDNRVIEMGEGEDGKPEYVVWDASLENAFKQIDKLVDFIQMVGEISPDIIGMGKGGAAESGRALKYKILRTIAKVARKKLYYNIAIKKVMLIAQEMGKAWNIEMDGIKPPSKPIEPTLTFADGLPIDESEMIESEGKAIDTGIQSKKSAIMRIYGLDEKEAEKKAKDIQAEGALSLPKMNVSADPFKNIPGGANSDKKPGENQPPNKE